jgi:hypothetical protein
VVPAAGLSTTCRSEIPGCGWTGSPVQLLEWTVAEKVRLERVALGGGGPSVHHATVLKVGETWRWPYASQETMGRVCAADPHPRHRYDGRAYSIRLGTINGHVDRRATPLWHRRSEIISGKKNAQIKVQRQPRIPINEHFRREIVDPV